MCFNLKHISGGRDSKSVRTHTSSCEPRVLEPTIRRGETRRAIALGAPGALLPFARPKD